MVWLAKESQCKAQSEKTDGSLKYRAEMGPEPGLGRWGKEEKWNIKPKNLGVGTELGDH